MPFVFLNDKILSLENAQIGIQDLSLLRGYGIFDYLRTVNRQPLFLLDYLNRFFLSAERMGLKIPQSQQSIIEAIGQLISIHNYEECGIRLLLTGGQSPDALSPAEPSFCIMLEDFRKPKPEDFDRGVKVLSCSYQRFMPEIKTINYHPLVYMRDALKQSAADDIIYHIGGIVSELSRCNVFYVNDGEIFTNEQNILKGVTRKQVLKLASQKFKIHFQEITLEDLLNADEVFLTSTTKTVMPICQIDEHLINKGKIGAISQELKKSFDALCIKV